MLDNSYEAIIAIYSIVLSNCICIPLDTDMHKRNIKYIVDDASISLIITISKYLNKFEELNKQNKFQIVSNYISIFSFVGCLLYLIYRFFIFIYNLRKKY